MKQTLLLVFALVAAAMSQSLTYEGMIERAAELLEMTKDDAQACFQKTNITAEDISHFDELNVDGLEVDLENTVYKFGCLFACLGQKKEMMTGATINMDKIKEKVNSLSEERKPEPVDKFVQLLDTCASQVATKTNECEVALTYVMCMSK